MAGYAAGLPAQAAAGADSTTLIGTVQTTNDTDNYVQRVVFTPPPGFATVTGQATNNATITVRLLRAGSFVANVALVTLNAGVNLVAETPLVVQGVTSVPVQQDDVLDCVLHQNGLGLAIGAGVTVEVEVNGR
jgi:hypothetical protein